MKNISRLMTRIGLGLFFLVFASLKFTSATWFIEGPYKMFYGLAFPVALVYIMGVVQLAMQYRSLLTSSLSGQDGLVLSCCSQQL